MQGADVIGAAPGGIAVHCWLCNLQTQLYAPPVLLPTVCCLPVVAMSATRLERFRQDEPISLEYAEEQVLMDTFITPDDGYLGSKLDEGRSKLR